jgi:glycosyltransferase involved in cell wall biosynthesis
MYVTAFRGRRDSYQVPVALSEAGLLDQFITDAYATPIVHALTEYVPSSLREKVQRRSEEGLSRKDVYALWGVTIKEWWRHVLGRSGAEIYSTYDPAYSRAAARRAQQTESDLLLYTPYAWEAFQANYSHEPRRILFQYHPHAPYERRTLHEDVRHHPEVQDSYRTETKEDLPAPARRRIDDAWQHADHVICASSFTRDTLVEAGANPENCTVVPYGISRREEELLPSLPDTFEVLFVGSGVQRKGLHHLLKAWQRVSLSSTSRLTLVCRIMDPGIEDLAAGVPGIRILEGVSQSHLHELYKTSTLFAMPSLIEGFGQVYLEALSFGCPVLGTSNTCLPDLGTEEDGVFTTPAGDIERLSELLLQLKPLLSGSTEFRRRARSCAERFTWPRFRAALRDCCKA